MRYTAIRTSAGFRMTAYFPSPAAYTAGGAYRTGALVLYSPKSCRMSFPFLFSLVSCLWPPSLSSIPGKKMTFTRAPIHATLLPYVLLLLPLLQPIEAPKPKLIDSLFFVHETCADLPHGEINDLPTNFKLMLDRYIRKSALSRGRTSANNAHVMAAAHHAFGLHTWDYYGGPL